MPGRLKSYWKSAKKSLRKVGLPLQISDPPIAITPTLNPPSLNCAEPIVEPLRSIDLAYLLLELGESSKTIVPLLGQTVNQLNEQLGNLEANKKNQDEYIVISTELRATLLRVIAQLPIITTLPGSMEGVVEKIQEQTDHLKHYQMQKSTNQLTQKVDKSDKLLACYRQIATLFVELVSSVENASQIFCREQLQPVEAASYNSPQSVELGRQLCEEGPFTHALDRITFWGNASEPSSKVYWVNGAARTGKTTIAYTVCSNLRSQERLVASFFCSRLLVECRDIRRVIPTITYQLAQLSHPFRCQLCPILKNIPNIDAQQLTIQFQKLIQEPIMAIKDTLPDNLIIVIDALDELDDAFGAQTIMKLIFESAAEIPIKFLITSRPDRGLPPTFISTDNHISQVQYLPEVHETIVQREQPPQNLHQQRMDELYTSILKEIFEDPSQNAEKLKTARLFLLWSASCIKEPLTVTSLVQLLKLDEGPIISAWGELQFVLGAPVGTRLITTPPASFLDFIFSKRSGEYMCSGLKYHGILAQRCFEVMQDQLRFNGFNLEASLIRDEDIRDIDTKVNAEISEELAYSCLYSGVHLRLSAPNLSLIAHLHGFITHQILAWLEMLNLKKKVSLGISMLSAIEAWLCENDILSDLIPLVHDARKFLASLAVIPVCSSTPHIYVSLLSSWRPDSPMFQVYGNLIRDIVGVDGVAISYPSLYAYYNPEFLPVHNTQSASYPIAITSSSTAPSVAKSQQAPSSIKIPPQTKSIRLVMVSADNKSIISAAGRLAVSVWDRETGKGLSGPFYFRPACFGVVAFSADAKLIATTTTHREILIWDASTEKLVAGPFQGHGSWVAAIAFSPDGTRIVSGARDQLVMVWDIGAPSTPVRRFEGHTGFVLSVTFSPDGSRVVSASTDHTVRVWDVQNEDSVPLVLTGHTECVRSVDVSPDGTRVVSGADDHSVRIWDIVTGQAIHGPLEGHSDYALCVKFSPDGRQVVSGSQDCTVRVWDVDAGDVVAGPFTSHTGRVNTVTFSMDGTQVISGSDDGTIRVWDVQARAESQAQVECAPADAQATGDSNAWKLNPDGWVVDKDGGLLMWLPPLSHDAIRPPPADHMVIPRIELPMSSLLEGNAWKELCRRQEGKSIRYEISVPVSEGTSI